MPRNVILAILRGLKASIPVLNPGELYLATDSLQVYMGTSGGNKLLGPVPVYDNTGALQNGVHFVTGSVVLPAGGSGTVTLSGSAVFTSASSYVTMVTDNAVKKTLNVVQNSGTSFTISGGGTGDVIRYLCLGN